MTDNPEHDFDVWDAEQTRRMSKLPVCSECGNHITDEFAYHIDGEWICETCIDAYWMEVDDD